MEINQTRINKFLSETGYCSRREADKLLEQGRITINGVIPELGTKVSAEDEIRVDGKLIREKNEKPVIAFDRQPWNFRTIDGTVAFIRVLIIGVEPTFLHQP